MVDLHSLGQRLVREHQAVPQHVGGDVEHVLGDDERPLAQQGQRLAGGDEPEGGSRGRAVLEVLDEIGQAVRGRLPRRLHDVDGVLQRARIERDIVGGALEVEQGLGREHHRRGGRRHAVAADDLGLLAGRRVVHEDLHQEAIPLGLGQGVHALVLDGVLGGHDEERLGDGERLSADGDLVLGHDLEQRRLHLGRSPVDLVGQQEVDEHRAQLDIELLAALAPDARAGDVGRQEVGGELDAGEGAAHGDGEGLHGQGLGQTGHALEQQVPAGEQADQEALDHAVLADDDPLDLPRHHLELHRGGRYRWRSRCRRHVRRGLRVVGTGRLLHPPQARGVGAVPGRGR